MRSWALRGLPPRMLISCLVPLAVWGTVVSPTFPASATTRPGLYNAALFESASSSPPPPATLMGTTVVLDPGHNSANASHPAQVNLPVPNGRGRTNAFDSTGTSTDRRYP